MKLDQVMNESNKNPEIIPKRRALRTDKWESELAESYFKVNKESLWL